MYEADIMAVMAARPTNISLTPELKAFIDSRVRSGLYGNFSDVIRAGLRALIREELGPSLKRFEKIMAALPADPITSEIEQDIERRIQRARSAEKRKIKK